MRAIAPASGIAEVARGSEGSAGVVGAGETPTTSAVTRYFPPLCAALDMNSIKTANALAISASCFD